MLSGQKGTSPSSLGAYTLMQDEAWGAERFCGDPRGWEPTLSPLWTSEMSSLPVTHPEDVATLATPLFAENEVMKV